MDQLERLKEFGLNPDEWKQTYSVNQGQLYFFIWDESINPSRDSTERVWTSPLKRTQIT